MALKSPFSVDVATQLAKGEAGIKPVDISETYRPQFNGGLTDVTFKLGDLIVRAERDRDKNSVSVKEELTEDKWCGLPYLYGFFEAWNNIDDLLDSIQMEQISWLAKNYSRVCQLLREPETAPIKRQYKSYVDTTFRAYTEKIRKSFSQDS